MTKKQHICDQCETDANGSGYQVCADYSNVNDGLIDLKISNNIALGHCPASAVEYHYCGRNCLILALNKIIDLINNKGSAVDAAAAPMGEKHHG
jgi:hypothetical protein